MKLLGRLSHDRAGKHRLQSRLSRSYNTPVQNPRAIAMVALNMAKSLSAAVQGWAFK